MESNVVKHQLLMLKRTKEREKEWSQRSAAIVKNLDSLVFSCTDDQMLPLQSIRSLIDNSYCLKEVDDSLVIDMVKFSTYKRSKSVWYSPPFYVGGITGLKLRLAVYTNGIRSGLNTHISLIIQNLERDVTDPLVKPHGMCILISVKNFKSQSPEFCGINESEYIP